MNNDIFAITLVARDLAATEKFYGQVFGVKAVHSDEVSRVFKFGSLLINCLDSQDAANLFLPATVAAGPGHASMLTIQVESVDAEAARLDVLGVKLNTPPSDKPWGIRTITFRDPSGQLWEFSNPL